MAQSDLDRDHAATPYKLQKAREKGQVAKSADVAAAVVFASAMTFLAWNGWSAWRDVFRLDQILLSQAGRVAPNLPATWSFIERAGARAMALALPFFGALAIAAIVGNLFQTGPLLSFEPLKPDWDRLNPVNGMKRLMSGRTLFLALRAVLKLAALGLAAFVSLKALVPQFYRLSGLSPAGILRALLDDFASLGLRLAAVLVLLAFLDAMYSKREFAKKMRMSRREMKDEAKNRDGDPRIRARLRELRREVLKRTQALRKTKDADVVVTNPTHVAVALRYVHGQMESPQLLAKGQGFMAAAIRRIAARHGIPVVQSPALARKLYRELAIDQHVQPESFSQVARIIVWVFARRGLGAARGGRARDTSPSAPRRAPVPREKGSAWTS